MSTEEQPSREPMIQKPGYVAKAGGISFDEIGTSGLRQFGGYVLEEWLTKIQGRRAAWVWREMMDNSPIVGAILFAIEWLARGVPYRVEPGNSKDAAEFVEQCMHDMSAPWGDTVSEALSMLPYGWSYHEIVYKRRQGLQERHATPPSQTVGIESDLSENTSNPASSKYDDGKIGWRKIPVRAQETLLRWHFDGYSGISAMEQIDWHGGDHVIPIEKALLFRARPRRNNPEGYSVLRTAYTSYFMLKNIQQIEAIGIERDLAGLPVLTPPDGVDIFAPSNTELLAKAQALVTGVKRDEDAGIILPTDGWKFELMSSGGSRQIDTDEVIRRYEQRIATSMLADFVLVGQDAVGSYAMVDIKADTFGVALDGILDMMCDVFNRYAIPRLLKMNGMDASDPPKITHGSAGRIALEKVGTFLQSLALAGAPIPWSVELLRALFLSAGLPANFEEHEKPESLPVLPRDPPPTEPVGTGTGAPDSKTRVSASGTTAQAATQQVKKLSKKERHQQRVQQMADASDRQLEQIDREMDQILKADVSKGETPPNFRTTDSKTENCHTCAFMGDGGCRLYDLLSVAENEVCASWTHDGVDVDYILSLAKAERERSDEGTVVSVAPHLRHRAQVLSAQLEREMQAALSELGDHAAHAYQTFVHKAEMPNIRKIVSRVLEALNIRQWLDARLLPILRNHAARTMVDTQRTLQTEIALEMSIGDEQARQIVAQAGVHLRMADIDEQVRETIAKAIEDGFAAGENPTVTGRRIRDQVPAGRFVHAGSKHRANLIARDQTAQLQRSAAVALYQSNPNIVAVRARDGIYGPPRSDAQCMARDGEIVPIDQADSLVPFHPLCTLGVEPVVRGTLPPAPSREPQLA